MAKKRIMVVEDEGITAMRIQNSLNEMGYSVISTVFSGEEAVTTAIKKKPDLVLMDIALNGKIDGIEAASQIHSQSNIPIVYLTAHSDESILKRIKATDPFGYIIKPFDESELRIAVELAFYKYEMETKLRKSELELQKNREQLLNLVEERTSELKSSNELLREEINDRMQAEAEAVRTSHLASLGELAAGVAHEINNPINGIINYAQILLNTNQEGSSENDIAGRIIRESDRIAGIVRGLLSFAHDSRGEKQSVFIHKVMSDALTLISTMLKQDCITLKINIPEDISIVSAQPHQLEQVFMNIISNARYALNEKYPGTDKNKTLEVTCKITTINAKPYIQISFFDRGTGIPDRIINKIMNPFFTTKPSNSGTGLGLSISQSIISSHGGKLIAESIEGEHTKISVILPPG